MVVQGKLKIRHVGCVSEKVIDGARVVHMSGDERHCLSIFKATSEAQLQDLLDGNDEVLEPTGLIDRDVNWAVVRCHCPQHGSRILPIIREMDCTVIWPVIEADGHEFYTLLAPSRKRFQSLVERLKREGEVHVERARDVAGSVLDVAVPLSDLTHGLTRRQIQALRTAVAQGYYDTPRRVRADELADAMGTSRSTYQEHLQKAEAVVMKAFAALVLDHPALDEQATKGPGRPKAQAKEA